MSDELQPPKLKLMFSEDDVLPPNVVRMHHALYGGEFANIDGSIVLPFTMRKEAIEFSPDGKPLRIVEPASERVQPQCVHFKKCGGCQYQMIAYREQITIKRYILLDLLRAAGIKSWADDSTHIYAHEGPEYRYRNRIRLRVMQSDDEIRFGYNLRGTTQFLPITECPIAAPVLWETCEAILRTSHTNEEAKAWLSAATEVEPFVNDTLDKIQLTFLCPPRTRLAQGSFTRMMNAIANEAPAVVGAGAIALDPKTGPTGKVFDTWGADGLSYRAGEESYWVSRGGFFQVNRFLLPELVELVTKNRSGNVAWDLFAGVGLFSRVLTRTFQQVTAVESNPSAARDLAIALKKLGPQHRAIEATTLDFLRRAITGRERPDLLVLDPPRAGAGIEACELITRLAPSEIVYVSCDPTTLARDLAVLITRYEIVAVRLVDLFPQTYHLETVVVLRRKS